MIVLHPVSRAALAAAAFLCFGGAFVTTPIAARGAASALSPARTPSPRDEPPPIAGVTPKRDPFAGEPPATPRAAQPVAPASSLRSFALAVPPGVTALPPNAGAGSMPSPFGAPAVRAARVTAVVGGTHPYALLDDAGAIRIVTTGDRIDGDTIVAIDADRIRLAHGAALVLTPSSMPSPGGR
jgi:hypothetical protein